MLAEHVKWRAACSHGRGSNSSERAGRQSAFGLRGFGAGVPLPARGFGAAVALRVLLCPCVWGACEVLVAVLFLRVPRALRATCLIIARRNCDDCAARPGSPPRVAPSAE